MTGVHDHGDRSYFVPTHDRSGSLIPLDEYIYLHEYIRRSELEAKAEIREACWQELERLQKEGITIEPLKPPSKVFRDGKLVDYSSLKESEDPFSA